MSNTNDLEVRIFPYRTHKSILYKIYFSSLSDIVEIIKDKSVT
jgi:hypothetical protein